MVVFNVCECFAIYHWSFILNSFKVHISFRACCMLLKELFSCTQLFSGCSVILWFISKTINIYYSRNKKIRKKKVLKRCPIWCFGIFVYDDVSCFVSFFVSYVLLNICTEKFTIKKFIIYTTIILFQDKQLKIMCSKVPTVVLLIVSKKTWKCTFVTAR